MKGSLFLKLPFSFVETGAHPKKHRLPGTALFVPASGTPGGIGSARGSRRLSRRRSPARPWLRPLPFRSCFFSAFQYIGRSINKCVNNRRTLRIKLFLQTREYRCAGTRARRRTRYLYYFNIWLFSRQVNKFFQTLRRLIRDLQ